MLRWLAALALFASCAPIVSVAPNAPNAPTAPIAPAAPNAPNAPNESGFDFTRTLRVDYLHAGGPKGETITLDAVVSEGEWAGSRTQLIDTTNLGKYIFEVVDRSSNRVIYSRGFATIYGEWETTPEFRTKDRTFHESLRFPQPNVPVRVVLKKRDLRNAFQPLWETEVDPHAAIAASLP